MCGYVGAIGYGREDVLRSIKLLKHRGPDSIGDYQHDGAQCVLAHARLKIIDLDDRANQPFRSADGRYVMVFNGEIYNYKELRQELMLAGEQFSTNSDTEVLLKWIIRFGFERLLALDGMYSFALLDQQENMVWLARDPIGEKPLYLAETLDGEGSRRFAFGSEIKALLNFDGVSREIDHIALTDYCRFLYTIAPHTLYKGIKEVPPGHLIRLCKREGSKWTRFYSLEQHVAIDNELTLETASSKFADLLRTSIHRRLISDVDVGLFLSGGIDSNVLLGLWADTRERPLKAFVAKYDSSSNESHTAQRSAARYGISANVLDFDELEFHSSLDRVIQLFDQPFGNSTAIVAEQLSARAALQCRVCLVGDGGDEVSGGYPRYRAATLHQRMGRVGREALSGAGMLASSLPEIEPFSKLIRRIKRFTAAADMPTGEAFIGWSSYVSTAELGRLLGRADVETSAYRSLANLYERHQKNPLLAAALVDFESFIPYNLMQSADRTGMAHGLELRSPFLCRELVEFALTVPDAEKLRRTGLTKPLITTALKNYLELNVATGKKLPFNPPLRRMLMRHIDELESMLLAKNARLRGWVDINFVQQKLISFRSGQDDCSTWLWGMASLERWLQIQH